MKEVGLEEEASGIFQTQARPIDSTRPPLTYRVGGGGKEERVRRLLSTFLFSTKNCENIWCFPSFNHFTLEVSFPLLSSD